MPIIIRYPLDSPNQLMRITEVAECPNPKCQARMVFFDVEIIRSPFTCRDWASSIGPKNPSWKEGPYATCPFCMATFSMVPP